MKYLKILFLVCITLVLASCVPDTIHNIPCGDSNALITAINDANSYLNAIHTINLDTGCIYELDHVDNMTDGNNGLPAILARIVVNGSGAEIQRSSATTDEFRFFHVSTKSILTLNNVILKNGVATNPANPTDIYSNSGGAIYNEGQLILNRCIIKGNASVKRGSGVISFGNLGITDTTIHDNHAGGFYGAVYNTGEAFITNSTISFNGPYGALGIFNAVGGSMVITNSTISENKGHGIDNEGDLQLVHVTIANNRGGIVTASGSLTIENTIIGPNFETTSCSTVMVLTPIGINIDTDGSCGVTTVTPDMLLLGPLADNGGSTQTHALHIGSPAIDAAVGGCLSTDQRGISRPFGSTCDIGAFEYQGVIPTPTIMATSTSTPTLTPAPSPPIIPLYTPKNTPKACRKDINEGQCLKVGGKWVEPRGSPPYCECP